MSPIYRIGIDVGGTNTDAVVLKFNAEPAPDRGILAWHKAKTTPDVTEGIASALRTVLTKSQVPLPQVLYLSIGTTHFLNAVVEADSRRLSKVAVIRLGAPYTSICPPFIDFPPHLRAIIEGHAAIIDGGLQIDGKEITPVSNDQIKAECQHIKTKGIKNVVLVGVFSPLASSGTQEEYARSVIHQELGPDINVVCSKDVGHVGLLERENASILNAAILTFARKTVRAYQNVLKMMNLGCPLYLTQLDGSLIPASLAVAVPIRTFSNGPTNSMRGASYLAGLDLPKHKGPVVVADVGGTTTDIGVLLPSGFPRKAAAFTEVGGVRTSFSMPDIHSIGLGGGSLIRLPPEGMTEVGPDSVGYEIQQKALVFGGTGLTATDVAVALGFADIGDASKARARVSSSQLRAAMKRISSLIERAIDRMKTDPDDVTLLLVGGGSVIIPDQLKGVKQIHRPPFFSVANAVGAAIARISGSLDRIEIPGSRSMNEVVEQCKTEAIQKAIDSGASPASVAVAEVAVVQLPYIANGASRVIIRAIGDLDLERMQAMRGTAIPGLLEDDWTSSSPVEDSHKETKDSVHQMQRSLHDIVSYKPNISSEGVWYLTELDLEFLADGCAVLGCGGGGATYSAFLMAREALRKGANIRVVDHTYFKDPSTIILPCGFMGSPSVSSERIPSGREITTACTNLLRYLGIETTSGVVSTEIGGKNGLEPMLLSLRPEFNCPVVDGDLMGRAYPRLNQISTCIGPQNGLAPVAAADGLNNCMLVPAAQDSPIVEDILRAACTVLGSSVALAISPIKSTEFERLAISRTTSQAWRIGRAIAKCRASRELSSIPAAITQIQDGKRLYVGKIVDVKREVRGGFTHGQLTISPLLDEEMEGVAEQGGAAKNTKLVIPFQNENLQASIIKEDGMSETICSVPDLIAVLDSQNGASIGTQDYRYGLRVTVVGMVCDPRWTTPEGLKIGGPEAFGLTTRYDPIGSYNAPQSVIAEFSPAVRLDL